MQSIYWMCIYRVAQYDHREEAKALRFFRNKKNLAALRLCGDNIKLVEFHSKDTNLSAEVASAKAEGAKILKD
jgi:hypothetical protein